MVMSKRLALLVLCLFGMLLGSCGSHTFYLRVTSGGDKGNHFVMRPTGLIERVHESTLSLPPALQEKLQKLLKKLKDDPRLTQLWQPGRRVRYKYSIRLLKTPGTRASHAVAGVFLILVEIANVGLAAGLAAGSVGGAAPVAVDMVYRLGVVISKLFSDAHGTRMIHYTGRVLRRNHSVQLHNNDLLNPTFRHLDPGDIVGYYRVPQGPRIYGPFTSEVGFFDLWVDSGALLQGQMRHLASRLKISMASLAGRFLESHGQIFDFPQKHATYNDWDAKSAILQGEGAMISDKSRKLIAQGDRGEIKADSTTHFPLKLTKESEAQSAKPGQTLTYKLTVKKTFIKHTAELLVLDALPRGLRFVRWRSKPRGVRVQHKTSPQGLHYLRLYTRDFGRDRQELVFRYVARVASLATHTTP